MSFPLLTAHHIYPFFFQLSSRLSPSSIRDQMVRGQMLVDQALAAGVISPDRPLLVVGAGAAGATVAMHAVRHGVHTLLVDQGLSPFRIQAASRSRWLDPAQYDWTVNHWYSAQYPWQPQAVLPPLAWRADWAHLLAARWMSRLHNALQQYPWLWVRYGTTAIAPALHNNPHGGGWTINFTTSGSIWQASFGMVVWTVGFGQETSFIRPSPNAPPTFSGVPFWATDPFAQGNYGLPGGTIPRIVISGAGDGGLQDFLRIMTVHRAARDIMRALRLPRRVVRRLQSAEDRAQRAYHWGYKGPYDHEVLRSLHREHRDLAQHMARQPQVRNRLQGVLRPTPPDEVHLVHSCDHFPYVYGLNRFLVLLIDAYLGRPDLIIPNKYSQNVVGVGHTCPGQQHWPCYGQDHRVELADAPNCWQTSGRHGPVLQVLDANIVVIRHGIDLTALPQPQLPDIALPRQLPPYHVHV